MTTANRKYLVLTIVMILFITAHALLHDYLVSYLAIPVTLSLLMAFTIAPTPLVILLVIAAELFTFLPHGITAAAVLLPFGTQRFFARVEPRFSGGFLAVIYLTATLQILLIGVAPLIPIWQTMDTWRQAWYSLPISSLLLSIFITSVVLYVSIILWYEIFPPQQDAASPRLKLH